MPVLLQHHARVFGRKGAAYVDCLQSADEVRAEVLTDRGCIPHCKTGQIFQKDHAHGSRGIAFVHQIFFQS